ncbi:MAG: hypothetical protein QM682_07005 [Paracoccus sp. (in: a-proteobacteria)]|uniref:hypothetical protein n=1 Tax=Paracoccus sp. TaxID=267 RepID=UPI0039E23129
MIRPELRPWTETALALGATGFGLWVFSLGGWVFWPLGALIAGAAALWALDAWRRRRFRGRADAPGLVELDEGAIRYLTPNSFLGGEMALRDLSEIRLLRLNGAVHWRLKSRDGQALLIPRDAAGAERLAGAFASLPGADLGRISAALTAEGPAVQTLWRSHDRPGLT